MTDEIDLEAEYNNRARVPDHMEAMGRWKATAEAARMAHPPETIAYGPGPREVMDIFSAGPEAPVAVFLHGGYWQALDKDWFSGLAPPSITTASLSPSPPTTSPPRFGCLGSSNGSGPPST